jgi:hypothetical protein
MCLLNYVLNCEQHFSYVDPDLSVTGLARVLLYLYNFYTSSIRVSTNSETCLHRGAELIVV